MITESEYKKALDICRKYLIQKQNECKIIETQLKENSIIEFKGVDESDLGVRAYNKVKAAMGRADIYLPYKEHWDNRKKYSDDEFWKIRKKLKLEFELKFLKGLTEKDIKSWHNCGRKTSDEIINYVNSLAPF